MYRFIGLKIIIVNELAFTFIYHVLSLIEV